MRIGVIYRNIATTKSGLGGGGDVFAVYLLKALKELGHWVILSTIKPTDWLAIEKDLGWVAKPDEEVFRPPFSEIRGLKLYRDLLPSPSINRLKKRCDITFNAYGSNLFWNTDLIYLHTPPTKEELSRKYGRNIVTKAYFKLYQLATREIQRKLKTRVLTNSEYSRSIVKSTTGLDARVVYPPVDTRFYRKALHKHSKRKNWVVMVSRYTWEKNIHLVPELAAMVRDAHFHILGNTILTYADEVLNFTSKKCARLGVSDRVHLYKDLSTIERLKILAKSKVYMNLCFDEHFGIAIAEAMAAGLTPIVPDMAGQKEIVEDLELRFETLEEAAQKINQGLGEWSAAKAEEESTKAERFSYERFRQEIDEGLKGFTNSR